MNIQTKFNLKDTVYICDDRTSPPSGYLIERLAV